MLGKILIGTGIVLALFLVLALVRLQVGKSQGYSARIIKTRRMVAGVLAALTILNWGGVTINGIMGEMEARSATFQDVDPDGENPAFQDADPVPGVNLTKEQLWAIIERYSRTYHRDTVASRNNERKAAIRALGEDFTDPVSFPLTEWLSKVDQILNSNMSADAREAQLKELREMLNQSIMSDPVIGDMWAQALSTLPLVTEENAWIEDFLAWADELYARVEPESESDPPRGLSAMLVYKDASKSEIIVCDKYAEFAAKLITLLDYFEFEKVTSRTSARNWCSTATGEDSASRTREATYQENRKALLLVYRGKDGSEVVAIGVNLYDQRAMIYGPDVKEELPPTTPPADTTTPPPTTTTTPKDEPKSHTLTIEYKYSTGDKAADTYVATLKTGEKYNVTSPVIDGWTADKKTVSGTMGNSDIRVVVTYTRNSVPEHTLTILYIYENGSTAAPTFTKVMKEGASHTEKSPVIEGYTPDQASVSVTMGVKDITVTVTYYPTPVTVNNDHTLTILYVYEDGSTAWPTYQEKYAEGASYSVKSPELNGYECDKPVVSGTMGKQDITVKVTYSGKHWLTINYQFEDGSRAAEQYRKQYKTGESYSVTSPTIKDYTPDIAVVSGTMPDSDKTVTVTYKRQYTVTINYVYEDGRTAAASYVAKFWSGEKFSVKSPTIADYEPDKAVVSGTVQHRDIVETVTYRKVVFSLTIHYVYKDGGRAAADYFAKLRTGQSYRVVSPTIPGWTPTTSVVEGTMGTQDLVFTVMYTRDGAGLKDPAADPGNQGNAPVGGGTNKPTDGTGDDQPYEPPRHDYGNGDQSTGQGRDDLDQNGNSTTPLTPNDEKESSGTGGVDHPIVDANGGHTDNGDPPAKDPIPPTFDTTVTDNNTGNTTNTSDEPVNQGPIGEPDD